MRNLNETPWRLYVSCAFMALACWLAFSTSAFAQKEARTPRFWQSQAKEITGELVIRPDGQLTVGVDVQNTGGRTGDEVVQLYIRDLAASRTRPVKELKGFERITLSPGEKRRVTFTLTPEHLGFHNRDMRFVVEPGEFKVFVGTSSVGGLEASFQVTGN